MAQPPVVSSVSPTTAVVGSSALTLTVTGSGFISSSKVYWNGGARTTTFVSATSLSAAITADDVATVGTANVAVENGDLTSSSVSFSITAPPTPVPAITTLTPTSVIVGSSDTGLSIAGSNFQPNATVMFGSTSLQASVQSSTSILATVPASLLSTIGSYSITVNNPGPPVATSAAATLQVTAPPPPSITSLSPNLILQGASGLLLQVTGQGFAAGSVVSWNGTALNTTYGGPTSLSAQVPDALIAAAGVDAVTVQVPESPSGVFTTPAVDFTVTALPAGQFILDQPANDIVSDEAHALLYASVPSTAANYANDIIAIDPTKGTIVNSVSAGSSPNLLAISDDDQFLYVSLDGSSSVQRFKLPSLTEDINASIGADPFFGPNVALDLSVAPGFPHTWAVTAGSVGVSPQAQAGLSVFDDATQRGNSEGRNNYMGTGGFDFLLGTLTWGKDDTAIYGANNESTGFDFYAIPVTPSGPGAVTDYGGAMPGFNNGHIHFEPVTGFVYGDNGYVVNPANGSPVGQYPFNGPMAPDGKLDQAFFVSSEFGSSASGLLTAFDLTHFTPTGTYAFPNYTGTPTRLVRWGSSGLAMNGVTYNYGGPSTTVTGKIYIYSGALVQASPAASVKKK